MNAHRPLSGLASVPLVSLCTLLLRCPDAAAAPPAVPGAPEGVIPYPALDGYGVSHVPRRTLDEVMASFARWQHQVLADGSSVDFSVKNGSLAMTCSACGLTSPAAIGLADIDPETVVGYEAGNWHIGARSRDGTRDFFSVLRGESGAGADPRRAAADRRTALTALVDVYDLAYLTQNPPAAAAAPHRPPVKEGPKEGAREGAKQESAAASAPGPAGGAANAALLEELAAAGDISGVQQLHGRVSAAAMARALETAYNVRARDQMLAGDVDASLATLKEARWKLGKAVVSLHDREQHYVDIGNTYDSLARASNARELQALAPAVQQARADEPADADQLVRMLAQTLANRIADERAAGRDSIAAELLTAGRRLFPAQTNVLSQGRAGAL